MKLTNSYLIMLIFYFTFFIYSFEQGLPILFWHHQLLLITTNNGIGLQLSRSGGGFTNFLMRLLSLRILKFRILCEFCLKKNFSQTINSSRNLSSFNNFSPCISWFSVQIWNANADLTMQIELVFLCPFGDLFIARLK